MKKYLLSILSVLFYFLTIGQTFNPTSGTVSNKPYSPSQSVPTDARSYFYDASLFLWRPYQSTTEILTFLNIPKYRGGNVIYVVDSGGVLNPNGTYTNFHATFYTFADGVADANLVKLNLYGGSSGACVGCLLAANNLSDVANVATSRTNLGLGSMAVLSSTAGGDLSGTWPNISVQKFAGLTPSYYTNYLNLSNTPTIPAQFNPIAGSGVTLSGTYPNIIFSVSGTGTGFNTAGVYLVSSGGGNTINLDTANYRKVDSLWSLNDSVVLFTINNGTPDTLSIRGGTGSGGGGGSGTVTNVSVVPANGISGTVANPTSTPAITLSLAAITPTTVNGLTFAALSTGFTISGGTASRTLTVSGNANVSGTNTGDATLSGESYLSLTGQAFTANAVNVSGTNITGVLKATAFPAQTGDVTNSAGSLATTISANVVTNAKLAQMAAHTFKGNNTGSTANALDLTATQLTAELNTFTTTLKGLVPAPTTVAGKVLSDAGTWVINGTGNTNSNVGAFYRWAIPGTNNIKTLAIGYGILADSTTNANSITLFADTSKLAIKGSDTITVYIPGTGGFPVGAPSGDTLILYRLFAGANITLDSTTNPGGITITSTGGGGGGITTVGTINSQTPSSNGLVISGSSLYAQYATPTNPGMVSTSTQTFAGVKTFYSAPVFSTLTTNGGIFYGNSSGTLLQTGAGTSVQVLHGGSSPAYSAVNQATDITGLTPIINGGTGTATPALVAGSNIVITGSWPNNTITANVGVTSVAFSGGTTGLSVTGSPITSSGTFALTGTLGVANGGTALSSLTPYALIAGGSTAVGPMQQVSGTGSTGQYLQSNGSGALPSWVTLVSSSLTAKHIAIGSISNTLSESSTFLYDSSAKLLRVGSMGIKYDQGGPAASLMIGNPLLMPTALPLGNIILDMKGNATGLTGTTNVLIGNNSSHGASSGSGNVIINASNALSGSNVVAIGSSAKPRIDYDIRIGFRTGFEITSSSRPSIIIGHDTANNGPVSIDNAISIGDSLTYRSNIANFGTRSQLIHLGHNGGNTTKMNSIATPQLGDIYLNTDSSAYLMYNGTSWIKWGGVSSGGGSQNIDQVLSLGGAFTQAQSINTSTFGLTVTGTVPTAFNTGISTLGYYQNFVRKTANYSLTGSDNFVEADATSGSLTMTVPFGSPAGGQGQTYTIKKSDNGANTVTVVVNGGGLIDGLSSYILTDPQQPVTVISRGNGNYDVAAATGTGGSSIAIPASQIAFGNSSGLISSSSRFKTDSLSTSKQTLTLNRTTFNTNSVLYSIVITDDSWDYTTRTSDQLTGIGYFAAQAISGGVGNSFLGANSIQKCTTCSFNSDFGWFSGSANTTGIHAINIGAWAGYIPSTGGITTNTIIIGDSSGRVTAGNLINTTIVGHLLNTDSSNVALFGRSDQRIILGNGGGNTTAMNLFSHYTSQIFFNTDSTSTGSGYCVWNGIKWINLGKASSGGSQGLQDVMTVSSALSGTNLISTGTGTLSFSGTNFITFQNGINTLGYYQNFVRKTSNYTLTATDNVIEADPTGGNLTMTLPFGTAPLGGQGQTYTIKKSDNGVNTVTLVVNGGGLIDGVSSYVLTAAQQPVTVISRGNGDYDVIAATGTGGGGGGGGSGIGVDSVQSYTSGSTLTQTAGYNYIQLNPASTISSLTITTATVWHTSNDLYIVAGGSVTSGNVISSLTINPGSGLTMIQAVVPTTIDAGEVIRYHKIGSFIYRMN